MNCFCGMKGSYLHSYVHLFYPDTCTHSGLDNCDTFPRLYMDRTRTYYHSNGPSQHWLSLLADSRLYLCTVQCQRKDQCLWSRNKKNGVKTVISVLVVHDVSSNTLILTALFTLIMIFCSRTYSTNNCFLYIKKSYLSLRNMWQLIIQNHLVYRSLRSRSSQ